MGRRCEVLQEFVHPVARIHKCARVRRATVSVSFRGLITPVRDLRDYEEARKAFAKATKSQLDWPEMIWEAWLAFEHSRGSVDEIQDASDTVERARVQVEAHRAKVLISVPGFHAPC